MGWSEEDLARRNLEVFGTPKTLCERLGEIENTPVELPEWMIEAECTKLLEADGWRSLRTDPVSDRGRGKGFGEKGMCDHLYIRYQKTIKSINGVGSLSFCGEAQILWIEFKSASGKPKKHQIEWNDKERARGAVTWIAGVDFPASIEGFKAYYRASGLNRGNV